MSDIGSKLDWWAKHLAPGASRYGTVSDEIFVLISDAAKEVNRLRSLLGAAASSGPSFVEIKAFTAKTTGSELSEVEGQ